MSSKEKKKRQNRRSKIKNASLVKKYNSKVRQEFLDADYLDKLSEKELDWYARFIAEDNNANFNHPGKQIIKSKKTIREIYQKNNARNRDLYGLIRNKVGATKLLNYDDVLNLVEEELQKEFGSSNYEEALIEFLDYANNLKNTTDDTD